MITLVISEFDQGFFCLIQLVILGENTSETPPSPVQFSSLYRKAGLELLLSILPSIFMKCVRPTEWKWEIKCSECAVLIWVFGGIRVPITLDQAQRSVSLLQGSGCSGTECWLLVKLERLPVRALIRLTCLAGWMMRGLEPWAWGYKVLTARLLAKARDDT